MTVFYILNMFAYVGLIIVFYTYIIRYFRLKFLNPVLFLALPVVAIEIARTVVTPSLVLDDGFRDKYFQFAVLMTNIQSLTRFLFLYTIFDFMKRNHMFERLFLRLKRIRIKHRRLFYISLCFLFFYAVFFLLLAFGSVGLTAWLTSPRSSYEHARAGVGHYYALALSCLSYSYFLMTIYVRRISVLFLVFLFYIFLVFFFGSKGFILSYGIFALIILWLRGYRHLGKIAVFAGLATSSLILINLAQSLSAVNLLSIFHYFDFYINSAEYFRMYFNNEVNLFYGQIYLTSFWELVPRGFFPDKPYVYGRLLINEIMWPGLAERGNTPAFGGPIAEFADFGILGVILFTFFDFAFIISVIMLYVLYKYMSMERLKTDSIYMYLFVFMMAPVFLKFFGFPVNLVLFMIIITIFSFCMRVKI